MKANVHLNTTAFKEAVEKYVEDFNISTIVETGTNDGTGSTKVFADLGLEVHTCELKRSNYLAANNLFFDNKKVNCYHSFTTSPEDGDFLYRRNLNKNNELPCSFNWLIHISSFINKKETAFFLDTHWTMGFKEFSCVYKIMEHCDHPWVLMLDDVTNLKHRPTIKYIKQHMSVDILEKERWAIVTFNVDKK